jgi:hypothetical protein
MRRMPAAHMCAAAGRHVSRPEQQTQLIAASLRRPAPPPGDQVAPLRSRYTSMWWHAKWLRLVVLLTCLAASLLALLAQHGALWASTGSARAAGVGACAGRTAPQTAPASGAVLAQLRASVLGASPAQAGEPYEQGVVATANLWSDNRPRAGIGGGYEARWWALDSEGRLDDVVVDVLRFANAGDARRALSVAADPRCHRDGATAAATLPAGARLPGWLNPDGAWQQDTLLARGALLYRVSDSPPSVGAGASTQQARERVRASTVTQALACALPNANCPRGPLAALEARTGSPARASGASNARSWPRTAAQGSAYVRVVSLRPYDVPTMSELSPASRSGTLREPALLTRCMHAAPSTGAGVSASSPLFGAREGLWEWTAQSTTTLLASEQAAASYVAAVRTALAGACARRFYSDAATASRRSHPRVVLADLTLSQLALAAPDSYRGAWPYQPVGERASFKALITTRSRRRLRLSYFGEGFLFNYKRAIVALSLTATRAPIPQATLRYLESALVGRAEARWGRPPGP